MLKLIFKARNFADPDKQSYSYNNNLTFMQ